MTPDQAVIEHIHDTLMGDATFNALAPGGVWDGVAPRGTAYPLVIVALRSATDRNVIRAGRSPSRQFTPGEYLVKAVVKGGAVSTAHDILARVYVLLTDSHSDYVRGIYRTGIVAHYDEVDGDARYIHVPHLYRAISQ